MLDTPQVTRHLAFQLSVITQFYPPDYAATGQLIEELTHQLSKTGAQVNVWTGQPAYAFQQERAPHVECASPNVMVRRSRVSQIWPRRIRGRAVNGLLFCVRTGLRLLRSVNRGDAILVTTEPPYLPVLAYLAHKCFRTTYICLIYDLYPDVAVALNVVPETHLLTRLWNWFNQRVWRNAKCVIVLSSTMKQRVVARCPEAADKVKVIHSWSNPREIYPRSKSNNWFAREYGFDRKFTVLYSGNMGRCHDMETIMETAKQLRDYPFQFVFIGKGAKHQDCQDVAAKWQLDNCTFLDFQDKETLPYSLTACDLSLVSISPGMEGLVAPSKLYGILAAGRPVATICEPHSYLRNLIDKAGCGAAFDNFDSKGLAAFIRYLAVNPSVVERMGQSGRDYLVRHFTPEEIARQYAEAIGLVRSQPPALLANGSNVEVSATEQMPVF
ncbi:MAG: glycosyltransferase family 4 protein [Cyanobacteria bacterium J06642_2]